MLVKVVHCDVDCQLRGMFSRSTKTVIAPPTPFKFLDIGTKMGCYKIGEHIPARKDTENIFHPRFIGVGIPPPNTFHAVIHDRAAKWVSDVEEWCVEEAWFAHSPDFDFRVADPSGYIWGLPVLVPTCPKKLFAQGPRKKYVDIVTDTLLASSSDLITWNTLVMMKLQWIDLIPRQWLEITTQSLEAWKARDEKSPFLPDNRRGYARVTPVALSKVGVPNTNVYALDEYLLHGLYDDLESWEQYTGYVWSGWTTTVVQPVHIDSALQAMIDQSSQPSASAVGPPSHINALSTAPQQGSRGAMHQRSHQRPLILGCVIAQAFFSRGASEISLKSRVFSAELRVI